MLTQYVLFQNVLCTDRHLNKLETYKLKYKQKLVTFIKINVSFYYAFYFYLDIITVIFFF